MAERIFLEDIGKPYATTPVGHARVWEVRDLFNDPTLPRLIYVVESRIGETFLLGRGLSGRPKFNLIRYIANTMVELFIETLKTKDCYQYLILRGAYPFDLQHAFANVPTYHHLLLPTGFTKLQRVLNRDRTDWEVQTLGFIGEYGGETWLIPDTVIASGSTIAAFLRSGFDHHRPREVFLFTACGSLQGLQRIYQECLKKGVDLVPIYSQCLFEVSKEGNFPDLPLTDLPVTNPGTITTKNFYEKAYRRYQGRRMCCVGDVGESLDHPLQYTLHTLWEMQRLGMDPAKEDWSLWSVRVREEGFREKVEAFKPDLVDYFKDLWT
ncbi:MAG: hypothetical protein N3G78_02915 [Desulfobacterota bacterium]|nr:hypothetical protein [Thermodesulfobacteriota bacterium]